jgi:hypothetical protein
MRETDPELAPRWRASRVLGCLQRGPQTKDDLIGFVAQRHKARFFEPIKHLLDEPGSQHEGGHGFGYGFAVMALCALLMETIQSYWDGLPSTNRNELKELEKRTTPPAHSLPPRNAWPKNNTEVFKRFFSNPLFNPFFSGVDPSEFCTNIRNGLLHQAQAKGGWLLKTSGPIWDANNRTIHRTLFAKAVEDAFDRYVQELRNEDWEAELWRNARRKIWWLVELSKASGQQAIE